VSKYIFGILGEETSISLIHFQQILLSKLIITPAWNRVRDLWQPNYGRLTGKPGVLSVHIMGWRPPIYLPPCLCPLGGMPMLSLRDKNRLKASNSPVSDCPDIVNMMRPIPSSPNRWCMAHLLVQWVPEPADSHTGTNLVRAYRIYLKISQAEEVQDRIYALGEYSSVGCWYTAINRCVGDDSQGNMPLLWLGAGAKP